MNPIKLYKKNILYDDIYFKSINYFILIFTYDLTLIKNKYTKIPTIKSQLIATYIILNLLISSEYLNLLFSFSISKELFGSEKESIIVIVFKIKGKLQK